MVHWHRRVRLPIGASLVQADGNRLFIPATLDSAVRRVRTAIEREGEHIVAILVTGIAGFIGMHTAASLLARGETVIRVDSFNDYYSVPLEKARLAELHRVGGERLTVHCLAIGDGAALAAALSGSEFDRIVHLAAQAGVRHSIDNPAA